MRKHRVLSFLLLALLVLPTVGFADDIAVGYVSFDLLIPGDIGSPGVNAFDIGNLTGGFAIPGSFPVITALMFSNSSITLVSGGVSQIYSLGDLGSGFPDGLQFPDTSAFSSALFTATLDTTNFQLDGGGTFTASSAVVSALLLPSVGDTLIAGTDLALLTVSEQAPSTVPEPNGLLLLLAAVAGVAWFSRRAVRHSGY